MKPTFPGKILIIDDDEDIRSIYDEILAEAGFKIDHAKDGQQGLAKILEGGYDLILLDIMMPKIDGLSILRKLQKEPPTVYNGPIIVLSQLNQSEVINSALNLGAKGYLVKSQLTPDKALEAISNLLQGNKA